ncbi:thiol reductant ABC exporter subunit CydC [Gulosibacter molinativorax]|uniref:Thiol reductant ABC exporter subunit CydC n=1 Tax=Gulosibacter molinativorax TaxID=256821 RepID=A0ABT7C8S4_9MICO|nr:thiol reductant ABC exporter subunit CydC [Gulosibacter molinativorax]MDJ1371616.1 thiol reductant ABC exporter subunit CydC [Gulosibacter molinativorax]QUY61041.1 ABC transporter [Gulosibacter molinativorax]
MKERRRRSPIAGLGTEGKRALGVLAVVAAMNAAGLVLVAEALARSIATVFHQESLELSFLWVGLLGLALQAIATWANRTYSARAVAASKIELRQGLVRRVLRGSDAPTGAMGTLGTRGLDDLDEYFTTFLPAMVSAAIIPLTLIIRILFADWLSALIIVLTIPLVPLFMILIGLTTRDAVDKAQDALLRMSGHLVELARGLPVLVGLGRVREQVGALDKLSDDYRSRTMQTLRTVFMSSLAMELISTISIAVVAVFIGVRLVYGGLDLEVGLLVLILAPDCYTPFRQAGSAYHSAEDGVVALQRVEEATSEPEARPLWRVDEATRASTEPQPVAVRGLHVAYPGREPVFDEFEFTATAGESTLLDGPSGAGKTTLLAALAGRLGSGQDARGGADQVGDADRADAADQVEVAGQSDAADQAEATGPAEALVSGAVTGIDPDRLAWLPQHPHAYGETVMDELLLHARVAPAAGFSTAEAAGSVGEADPAADTETDTGFDVDAAARRAVLRVLGELGLLESVTDPANTPPHALSPGELRRLGVARVLLRIDGGATTALLDEPTAHLDPRSAELVRRALRARRGKATMLFASHDPLVHAMCEHRVNVVGASTSGSMATSEAANNVWSDLTAVAAPDRGMHPEPGDDAARADDSVTEDFGSGDSGTPDLADLRAGKRRPMLPQLARLLRPAGWGFALGILLALLAVVFSVTQTSISGWLIVRAAEQPPILLLMVAIVGVRFFGIGRAVLRYLERLQVHDAVFRLAGRLRHRLWTTLATTALRFKKLRTGPAALDLLVREVDAIRDEVPRVVVPPVVAFLTLVLAVIAAAIWLPAAIAPLILLGILSLVVAPALALVADRRATSEEERLRSRLSQRFTALLEAGRELSVHRVEGEPLRELSALESDAMRLTRRAAWAQGAAHALVIVATVGSTLWLVASVWASASAPLGAAVDAKLLAAFALGMLALAEPLTDGVTAIQRWPRLRLLLESVQRVLGADVSADLSAGADIADTVDRSYEQADNGKVGAALDESAPALELRNVSAGWPDQTRPVFEDLSLTVERGEWLTVTGPSGSGKSTMLATMMGHLPPLSGEVLVGGRPVLADTVGRIAWCPQEGHLFNSTLRGNLMLARSVDDRPTDVEFEAVLRRVGLGEFLDSLDGGLDTRIGADGSWLSGGQRQRVAIARTLLTSAPVVLLDEPTAHLDEEAAESLLRDLRAALADRAVVCVTHRAGDRAATDRELRLPARAALVAG